MFWISSKIKLGAYTFKGGFNDLVIKRSVKVVMDTATLKLPALSRVNGDDTNLPQSSVETAKLFKEGDKVQIEIGYNGELKKEFEGFVRRVNFGTPVTFDLEGYGWQLRRKNFLKSWKTTTVRAVLEELVKGTDILLSPNIPDIKLEKFYIQNNNGLEVLDYFKDTLHLTAYFNFNVLYVGIEQGEIKDTAKYKLGWNVIRDDQLKYRLVDDTRVKVKVQRKLKKGAQLLYETGDADGAIHTINLPNIGNVGDVKKLGDEALKKAKYTGYEGRITGFLQPYCEPGYRAFLLDPKYNERDGAYFTESTEVRVNMRGGRRIVGLSWRLN